MTVKCSIDRDSFQRFLADAFEVQESHLAPSSLSALVEMQQLVAKRGSDMDEIVRLIAERARTVAGADGAAIALLESSKLVYQAGSGTASSCLGRQVNAVLSPSDYVPRRSEILRVENADTDMRIEASICRQFEAQSLVMLPIYKSKIVIGVLQISFITAHKFAVQEIRTYGLIAGLLEDVLSQRHCRAEMIDSLTTHKPLSRTDPETPLQGQEIYRDRDDNLQLPSASLSSRPADQGVVPDVGAVRLCLPRTSASTMNRPDETATPNEAWKRMATVALLCVSIWSWFFYARGRETAPDGTASNKRQSSVQNLLPSSMLTDSKSDPRHPMQSATVRKGTHTAFKRIRVGLTEIDYVSDDVTIRHFLRNSTLRSRAVPHKTIDFGDDVTMRYFEPKRAMTVQTNASVAQTGGASPASVVSK